MDRFRKPGWKAAGGGDTPQLQPVD
jgi:hypothetical protein